MTMWTWADGETITAEKLQLITKHCVWTFNNNTERDAAIPTPFEGTLIYVYDTHRFQYWDGSAWRAHVGLDPAVPIDVPDDADMPTLLTALVEAGIINITT